MPGQTSKILEEGVFIEVDGRTIKTTAILKAVSGGKRVYYIAENGEIVKTQAYSDSIYYREAKKKSKE